MTQAYLTKYFEKPALKQTSHLATLVTVTIMQESILLFKI